MLQVIINTNHEANLMIYNLTSTKLASKSLKIEVAILGKKTARGPMEFSTMTWF
jgi:hypothetical protein